MPVSNIKKVTNREIASRLKVSQELVSRALKNGASKYLSQESEQRIIETAIDCHIDAIVSLFERLDNSESLFSLSIKAIALSNENYGELPIKEKVVFNKLLHFNTSNND